MTLRLAPEVDPELTGRELDLIYRTTTPGTGVELFYPVLGSR